MSLLASSWDTKSNSIYVGSLVFSIGFGFYLLLAVRSIHLLRKQPTHNIGRRILLSYSSLMLVMNTAFFIFMSLWTRALLSQEQYRTTSATTVVSGVIMGTPPVMLNDLLFGYRTWCILTKSRKLLIVPCMLYISMFVLGVLDHRGKDPNTFGPPATPYFLAFITCSIVLNSLLTCLTAWRLYSQYRTMEAFGMAEPGLHMHSWQATVVILMAESAIAWVVAATLYLAALLANITIASFFEYLFQITAQLSPIVLIYRVALNKQRVISEDHSVHHISHVSTDIPLSALERRDLPPYERKDYPLAETRASQVSAGASSWMRPVSTSSVPNIRTEAGSDHVCSKVNFDRPTNLYDDVIDIVAAKG